MKKKFGKFLSILLTAAMMLSLLPATAFANGRSEISNVVAVSDSGDITPEYGDEAADPVFTTTEGKPAYLDCNNWQKKVGDDWVDMADGDTFNGGTYRYMAQLRIDGKKFDGYDTTTHKLSQGSLTVTVDGKEWDKSGTAYVSSSVSFVRVYSPEFTVDAPDSMELTFYDSDAFDIARSYVGEVITSKNVAGNVEGGTKPYTFSKVSGPDWINVSEDGKITGTPTPEAVGPNEELVVKVTDSVGDYKTITITVASTKVNPADRTVISVVEVTSDINPMIGKKATAPTFTTTVGKPAYIDTNSWLKQVDGGWTYIGSDATFEEGCTYRYMAQLRIDWEEFDGYDYTTHMLSQESLTLTVDGEAWEVDGTANVDSASFVTVFSPAMVVEKIPVLALDIKGIAVPVEGATADVSGITINNNTSATVSSAKWLKEGRLDMEEMSASDQFEGGKTYYLRIQYELAEAYKLSDNPQIQHDLTGGKAVHEPSVQTIVITYTVPETYTVTVTTDGNGTAEASVTRAAAGTKVTLTATPNTGYEFEEWSVTFPRGFRVIGNSFTMPADNVVVKASFKKAAAPVINTINIKGITPPVVGELPVFTGITTDTPGVTLKTLQWLTSESSVMDGGSRFEAGETYTFFVGFDVAEGYELAGSLTATYDLEGGVIENISTSSKFVSISYTLPGGTPKTPITSAKISDVTTPVVGATPDFDITLTGTGVAFDEEEGSFFWEKYTDAWYDLDEDTPFGADLNVLTVYLIAQDGYKFTEDTKFYFGEEELPEWGDVDFGESCYEVDGDYASMYIYFDPADAPKVLITSVKLSDVTTPVVGATPDLDFTLTAVGADFDSWDPPCWYKYNPESSGWEPMGATFSEGYYKLEVWLAAKDGYEFTEDIEAFFGEKKLPERDDASDGESCYMYDSEEYVGFYLYFNVEDAAMDDVYRVYGLSRCDTALKAADTLKEVMGVSKFNTVIVANAQNFADALGGSYLAAKKDAPILMTNVQNEAKVKEYIRNNLKNGGTIYILGGPLAVASSFETGMTGFNVKRLYGTSRYDTNLEILKEAGVSRGSEVLVCTGTNFADSLSASATGKPILMVGNSLTANQKAYLSALNADYTIIGGPLAVNANVETEVKALGDTERIYGTSRFDTSVVVAQQFFRSPKAMVLAYAQNFPDGLSGGPLAYHVDGPLVLTQNGKQAVAAAYADANDIKGGYVMGGTMLISDDTVRDIFDMGASDPVIVK